MTADVCLICGSHGPFTPHRAREMQFGTREDFDYLECEACGTVQIKTIPSPVELERHYPSNYYSFLTTTGTARRWIETRRDRHVIGRRSLPGALYARRRGDTTLPMIVQVGVKPTHRVVDIGCGNGHLLDRMARLGYTRLLGVDPFIEADLRTPAGVEVHKGTMAEVEGQFDVVMFNHSLEHVPEPEADLALAVSRLVPGGLCLVRLPTVDSEGWNSHGVHWSSLDPPRHLVLPSRKGLIDLAARVGLEHVETIDDSHGAQYASSELYSRGISAVDPEAATAFTEAEQAKFQALAEESNRLGRGDQAMFVFRATAAR